MNNTIENTKLAGILKTFNKADRLAAKRFLESPYFNSSKEVILLFQEILRLQEKNRPLDKIKLWKKSVGNKTYSDLRFRKYCSDLSKLMERYLAQQAFEEDEIQAKIYVLKRLNDSERKAEKLASSAATQAEKMIEEYAFRDGSYFLYQFQLQRLLYELKGFETKRGVKSNIEEISNSLDWFYMGEKLRLFTDVATRKEIKAHAYNLSFKSELMDILRRYGDDLANLPHINIYYNIFQILSEDESDENYFELKELIENNAKYFPRDVAIEELYGAAQNYCVRRINRGDRTFLTELFELFKLQIDQDLLLSDGKLSPRYFRNIIVVALRLGEYNWTEQFISNFQAFIPENLRDNAVTFNLAQLYFHKKDYNKVIQKLRFVEYDDISYNLNSKTILMATYYELDEIEPLYSLTDTFRTYLSRQRKLKKLPQAKVESFLHTIRFIRQLIKVLPGDKQTLKILKEDIQSTKGVVNANWLLEKVTELE